MRTIFPVDRLDALLNLEDRISRKIAMAATSVGIVSPTVLPLQIEISLKQEKVKLCEIHLCMSAVEPLWDTKWRGVSSDAEKSPGKPT